MKTRLVITGLIVIVIVAAGGCASAAETAAPTQLSTIESGPADADATPQDTQVPFVPITANLKMGVGSTYYYVDGATLVAVPEGEFVMGSEVSDYPEHTVNLNDYWIYSTKVTNQQYALCVSLGHCTPPDEGDNPSFENIEIANNPVVGVTHEQAAAYCSFVTGRLPTEAEWEKAARGPDGNIYPWGAAEPSCALLNYKSCITKTSSVIQYPQGASYYGVLEMAGNVFEWVADWYDAGYYLASPEDNPAGPDNGTERTIRSSAFESGDAEVAVVHRYSEEPQNHREDLGFRCVVDQPFYFAPFCEAPLVHENQRASASVTCPEVDIEQYPACAKKLSTTNVVFVGPDDAKVDTGGCAPTGNPSEFSCLAAWQVSISATCQVDISGDPTCAPGYSLEGSICHPNGVMGACLPGTDYNSAQGCCSAVSQTEIPSSVSVCPVGTFRVEGQNTCTPNPVQGLVSVEQPVQLESCADGGPLAGVGTATSSSGPLTPGAQPTLVAFAPTEGESSTPGAQSTLVVYTPTEGDEPTIVVTTAVVEPTIVVTTAVVEPTIVVIVTTEEPPACDEPVGGCDDYDYWDPVKCECSCEPPPQGCPDGTEWNYCQCMETFE